MLITALLSIDVIICFPSIVGQKEGMVVDLTIKKGTVMKKLPAVVDQVELELPAVEAVVQADQGL